MLFFFLTKNRVAICFNNPTLGHISSKTIIQKDTFTSMLIAALFTRARTQKQPKSPSLGEWLKMWSIYNEVLLSLKKKNEITPFAATQTDLEMIILSEAGASQTAPVAKNPLGTSEEPETREGLIPGVRQVPWMRKSQPAPVFFPGKFHRQRSLAGATVHEAAENQTQLSTHAHTSEVKS